jgi:hypothetical protein
MRSLVLYLLAPLLFAACATHSPPQTAVAPASLCVHDGAPPVLRTDLPTSCLVSPNHVKWPGDDGFAPGTLTITVPPGALLDRYGDGAGNFLSPKGTTYEARALPYVCRGYAYTTYRVVKPIPVRLGTAAAWFGEPGGAVQVKTAECVNQLLAEGVLQPVPNSPPPACPDQEKPQGGCGP